MDALAELDHKQELVRIERENKALEKKAIADQATGQSLDPRYADRQSYAGTYAAAAAEESARGAVEALREQLSKMPLDGTANPQQIAEDFFKREFGNGTGSQDYDAQWVNAFRRQAEPLVVQYNEAISKTLETNALETIRAAAIKDLLDPSKATPERVTELHDRVLTVARGNQEVADKLFEGVVVQAFMNDGNTTAILNSLKQSGFADRNPDAYLRLSEMAHQRTNSIKTWQAGVEVEKWHADFAAALNDPSRDRVGTVLEFAARAWDIDSRHGVGQSRFMSTLLSAWDKATKDQAEINVILKALLENRPGSLVAAEVGVEIGKVMSKHFDPAIQQWVAMNPSLFPTLAQDVAAGKQLDPLGSRQAALEYAALVSAPQFVSASPEAQSNTYQSLFGEAIITATDPERAANAVAALAAYEARAGSERARKMLRSDEEWIIYQAAKASGKDYTAFFAQRRDNPGDTQDLADTQRGTSDWAKLLGKPDAKRSELEEKVRKVQDKVLLKSTGRDGFLIDPDVQMSESLRREFSGLMYDFLQEQKRTGGSLDLDKAAQAVLASVKQIAIALPGQDGSLRLVRKPRLPDGQGELRDRPISVPGGEVYLPVKLKNFAEEEEDPLETYAEDMRALRDELPAALTVDGVEFSPDQVFLSDPGATGVPGLHYVSVPGRGPITFYPGQKLTLPPKDNHGGMEVRMPAMQNVETPSDPGQFQDFLKSRLPPGFHLIAEGVGGETFYRLAYGFRLKKDRAWAEEQQRRLRAQFDANKSETPDQAQPVPSSTAFGMGIGAGIHPGSIRPDGFPSADDPSGGR
ncbi:hypothetical protein C1702_00290 [Caldimonas thermodepolymerans]|uniref:Uncharacterized protein n=2 Tax=Caldimonas thermodepolymerans TaxID=215580 RepID=A0A2S5T9D3_9BURK|nr:hypothetical protein C1702_00290 [Caldimonas thermodepolymerans]